MPLKTSPVKDAATGRIGYVTQELFLVTDTVAKNIAFGQPDDRIDMDRVIEAAKIAQAHEFITDLLPQGYETPVGERGVRLSGWDLPGPCIVILPFSSSTRPRARWMESRSGPLSIVSSVRPATSRSY